MSDHSLNPFSWAKLRRTLWGLFRVYDLPLLALLAVLCSIGMVAVYSAAQTVPERIDKQIINIIIASIAMVTVANVPTRWLFRLSPPIYVAGVLLLLATHFFGITTKGATRWLNLGIMTIQPSEILKLGLPMMLAWYFQFRNEKVSSWDFLAAAAILAIPVGLIMKQPDLGTSILVATAGFAVIFFAGLPWKAIFSMIAGGLAMLPILWTMLHDYQRERVLTLLNPENDPLGKGFHSLQALIAIGSGGFGGKGWMEGTQSHLDFIPERSTDFIFAVYSEEFGFIGNALLLALYFALVVRSLHIAFQAPTIFTRLLAGSIAIIFLAYAFVNMGMVCGILPVVGVPLPFISYGGTALIVLGLCSGILMNISAATREAP